jgi:hypothetical protein
MLVLENADALCLITQNDHARLAHDILALWTGDGLPENPLREELLLATAEHDNGWREVDAAPLTDPASGWPSEFRSYPESERQRLWRRAVNRFAQTDPLTASLIARHARRIHRDLSSSPDWQQFYSFLSEKLAAFEELCEISPADLDALYEYLWLADTLSLGACGALGACTMKYKGYELAVSPGHVSVHPFPFAGPLTLRVACRLLPTRRYSGSADLVGELASAHWQSMPIGIEPGERPMIR